MMRQPIRLWSFAFIYLALAGTAALSQNSQSYLNDLGSTSYGVNIPVENGFINISNGNLHLEFPLATHPQRGALSLSEKIVYDSRIWMFSPFGTNGSYHWWPYNVNAAGGTNASGGWRFVKGNEIGSVSYPAEVSYSQSVCDSDTGRTVTNQVYSIAWTDPTGTLHPFNAQMYQTDDQCAPAFGNPEYSQGINGGVAGDGSGYGVRDDGSGNPIIGDNNGTQVYPQIIDRYGNYWSNDSNGNLVDDTGRTPVIATQNGNVTYYDVLAPNGPINNNGTRVRYAVTSAPVPVATNFQQSDVYEWNPSVQYLTPVQSISLPDGSQYTFSYDSYGGLSSVTLPTGGVVQYGYTNFVDSSNTANRWLSSRTQGSNPPMTFTPSVVTACSNYSTGCVESVNLHKPSGDETVYQLTLNNGAWNTGVTTYTGSAAGGLTLSNITKVDAYANGCSIFPACSGANYLSQSLSTTVLYANGSPSVSTQSQALYNLSVGKISALKEWDYGTDFGGTPTRETDYAYTGVDVQQVTVLSNGNQAGQTTYGYTSTSTTYLQTISHWLNTGSPSITTYTRDNTGQLVSTSDPNGNPPSTISYQCGNSLPYQTTNALNQTTTYGYDCNSGAITSVRDPNDVAASRSGTTYAYEGTAGRLQSVSSPDGGQTTYGYPSSTEVDATVLATPSPSISSQDIVDSFGRKYQHIEAGVSSETTYDANGRIACVTNPHFTNSSSSTDGSTCITSYDGLDRPLVQQQPDGNTLQWSYLGNSTTSTDEASDQFVRTSNAFGHLTNVVEPTGASTTYTYDGLGNLSTVNQSGSHSRGFVYDSLSRLVSSTTPEVGTISYVYDANGNVTTKTAPQQNSAQGSGQTVTTTYGYDALNRLTYKNYSDGNWPAHFGYDGFDESGVYRVPGATNPIGRLTRVFNGGDSYQGFGYDAVGRLAEQSDCLPSNCNEQANVVHASYDLAGNVTSLTYPDGRVVTQGIDGSGHLQNVTFDNWNGQHVGYTYASAFTYTAAGAQAEVTYGNGVYIHTPYNNRQQMCQVWSQIPSQPLIDTHIYYGGSTIYCNSTPGNNGNITQVKDWRNPNHTRYFGYDALNRINAFSNGDGSMQQNYSYDSFGNLSQSGTLNSQVGFDSNNRINTGGYAYDAAGNLSSFYNGAFTVTYSYNAENALINFNNGAAGYITSGDGKRIQKHVGSSWTEYVYFGEQLLAEKNSDGTWSDYIYANGQKIARADSFNRYIQFTGTFSSGGNYGEMNLSPASNLVNYPIRDGDQLLWKQRQFGAYGGVYFFTNGAGGTTGWTLTDQNGEYGNDSLQTDGNWHSRAVNLSTFANATINSVQLVAEGNSPAGNWTVEFADIAVLSSDGKIQPIYNGATAVSASPWGTSGYSNPSISVQSVPASVGDTVYYTGDQIGSTRMLTSDGGWPISSSTFYPFGQEQDPSADPNHYKFATLERDNESGLDHATFRQLSSTQGRWMSPDPYDGSMDIAYPQTLNRYAYVGNNPLGYTDPTGLFGEDIFLTVTVNGCFKICAWAGPVGLAAAGVAGLLELTHILGLWGHPEFHGSLKLRPSNNGCPTVPTHPQNADVNANISQAKFVNNANWLNPATHDVGTQSWFATKVLPKAAWDYKTQGMQYDAFGNFNYGATGAALGLPLSYLQTVGGGLSRVLGTNNPAYGSWYQSPLYGHAPVKSQAITDGYNYYKNGCNKNE
jgi:RHS repeat-associated protein